DETFPWRADPKGMSLLMMRAVQIRTFWQHLLPVAGQLEILKCPISCETGILSADDSKSPYCLPALFRASPRLRVWSTGQSTRWDRRGIPLTRSFLTAAQEAKSLQVFDAGLTLDPAPPDLLKQFFRRLSFIANAWEEKASATQGMLRQLDMFRVDPSTFSKLAALEVQCTKQIKPNEICALIHQLSLLKHLYISNSYDNEDAVWSNDLWKAISRLRHLVLLRATHIVGELSDVNLQRIGHGCPKIEAIVIDFRDHPSSQLLVSKETIELMWANL